MKTANDFICPVCKRKDLVLYTGREDSKVLVIGDEPEEEDLKSGKPFMDSSGRILKAELGNMGINMYNLLLTNLWLHPNNKNEECFNHGLERLLKLSKGKELILLLGSEVTKFFTDYSVMEVAGLVVDSSYFSGKVMACPKPSSAFYGTIGEVRLSLQKFVREMKKL